MEHNTILLASGGIKCVRCSLSYFGAGASMMGACLGSKPATAEPPEWKGERGPLAWQKMAPGGPYRCCACNTMTATDDEMVAHVKSFGGHCGPKEIGHSPQPAATNTAKHPSEEITPLDRALSDFIERRKAKREMNPAPSITDVFAEALQRRDELKLSRAMLTPITFTAKLGGRT